MKTGSIINCLRGSLLIAIGVCICWQTRAGAAEDLSGSFDAANKLYEQGKFPEAALAYGKLIQSNSVSSAIYFNLGNAQFKAGRIGEAIVAYRRAELLAPRDPDVRANLQFARNQIQGPSLAPNRWQRWLNRLSLNEWAVLSATAFWVCLLLLAAMQVRPAWQNSLRNFALGAGFVTVLLGIGMATVWAANTSPRVIVITHDAGIRSSPLEESKTVFTVHDGAELAVLDSKDEWLQVSTGQNSGWLKHDQAQLLSAPR